MGPGNIGGLYDYTTRVDAAIGFMDRYFWGTGNYGDFYAMWDIYKGLEVTIGLDDNTRITNHLHAGWGIDSGRENNWYEGYCEFLVTEQRLAGYWEDQGYALPTLATAWGTRILRGGLPLQPPPSGAVPELPAGALVGLGLACLAALRFRSRRKR